MADPKPSSRPWLGEAMIDLAALGGAAMVVHGVEMIHHPSGVIAGGLFLLIGAWRLARTGEG